MREQHACPHPKHTNAKTNSRHSSSNDPSNTVTGTLGSGQKVSELKVVKKHTSSHAHTGQDTIESLPCTPTDNLDSTLSAGCIEYTDFDPWSDTVTEGTVKAFLSVDSRIQYNHLKASPRPTETVHTTLDSVVDYIETTTLEKSVLVYRTIAEALSKVKSTKKEVPLVCLTDIHKVEDLKMLKGSTAVTRKELREKTEAQKSVMAKGSVKPELTRTRSPKKQKVLTDSETVSEGTPAVEKKKVGRKSKKIAEKAAEGDVDLKPLHKDESPEKHQEAAPEKGHKSRGRKPKNSDEAKKVSDDKDVKKSPKKKLEKTPPDIVVTPPKTKQKPLPKKSPSPRRKADTSPKKTEDGPIKSSPKEKKRPASMSPNRRTRVQSKSPSPSRKKKSLAASGDAKTSSSKLDIPETEASGNAKRTRSPSARFKEDIILYPWESVRKSPKKSPVGKAVEKGETDMESASKEKLNADQDGKSDNDKVSTDINLADKNTGDKLLDDKSPEDMTVETNPDEKSSPRKTRDRTLSPKRKLSPQKEKSGIKESKQDEPTPGPSNVQIEQVARALTFDADVMAVEGITSVIPKDFKYKYQPTQPTIPLSDLISKVSSALESSDEKLKLLFGEAEEPEDVEEMDTSGENSVHANDESLDSDRTLTEFNNSLTLNTSVEDGDKEPEKEDKGAIEDESAKENESAKTEREKENKNLKEESLSFQTDNFDQEKASAELKSDKDNSAETSVQEEQNCDTNKAAITKTENKVSVSDESQTIKDDTKSDESDNAQQDSHLETKMSKNDICSNLDDEDNKNATETIAEENAEDENLEEKSIFDIFGLKLKKQPTQNKTDIDKNDKHQTEISSINETKGNEKSGSSEQVKDTEKVKEQMNIDGDDDDDVMIIGESSPKKEVIVLSDVESPEKPDSTSARAEKKAKFISVNKCVEPKPLEILTRHEKSDADKRSVFLSHELEAYIAVNKENVVPSSDNKCKSAMDMKQMLDNPYPDFDELDDMMFLSFPCEQALKAHVNLEKKVDWLNDGSIKKMGQLKAMRERQQDQGAKRLTDVKVAPEQKHNYRGYPMRITKYNKLLKQELEAILYGYEDSAQMPFQKTPEKTSDITKIKGWKHKFKNAEEMQAAAGLQVSESGKVHWKTEERLLKNLDPDDVKDIGIDLHKKRRKLSNLTKKKGIHKYDTKDSPNKTDSEEDDEDWENWEGAITEKDVYNENDEKTPPGKIPYREKYHSQHKYGARKQFVKTMGLDSKDELILKKLGTQKLPKDFEDPQKEELKMKKKSYFTLTKLSHSMAVAATWAIDKALISRSKAMSKGTRKDKKRAKQHGIKAEVRAAPAYTYRINLDEEEEEDYTEHDDDAEGSSESEDEGTEGYEEMDPHEAEAKAGTEADSRSRHRHGQPKPVRLRLLDDTKAGGRSTPKGRHDDAEGGTGRLRSRQRTSSKAAEDEAQQSQGGEGEAGRTRAAHRSSRLSREQVEEQLEEISRDKKKVPRKENCDQPGCRFGCVCHLCKLSDSSEEKEADVKPPCDKEYCKLGCICESIDAKLETKPHCRKPACMLGCKCPPRQPKPDIPKEHRGHKGRKKKTKKDKKRKTHAEPKEEEEESQGKEESAVTYDDAEDWEPPSKRKRGSNNSRFANLPKRESTYRLAKNLDAVSRKAMEVYNSSEVYAEMKIRRRKSDPVYDIEMDIDQPSDMVDAEMGRPGMAEMGRPGTARDADGRRKHGNDQSSKEHVFEISDEESDGEQFPPDLVSCQRTTVYEGLRRKRQGLRRRQNHNSGNTSAPVVIDLIDSDEDNSDRTTTQADRSSLPCSSGSVQKHSSAGRQTVSEKLGLSRKHGEDSTKWKTQMVCLKAKRKADDKGAGPQSEIKLLEIISNCNWEADRTNMLSKISHTISKGKEDDCHSNGVIMWQNYILHFLPRANRPAVIPPELQSKLPNAMYSIRVRVTQNISDVDQAGENDLEIDEKEVCGEDQGKELTEEERKQQNTKLQKKLIDKIKFAEKLRDLIMAEEKKGSDPSKFSVSLEGIQKALKKYKTQLWKAYTGSNNMTLMQLKKAVAAAKSGKPGTSGGRVETKVSETKVQETKDLTSELSPSPSVVGFQQHDMNATLARIHANQGLKIVCPMTSTPAGFIPLGHLSKNMALAINSTTKSHTATSTFAAKPVQPVSQISSVASNVPPVSMQPMAASYANMQTQGKATYNIQHKTIVTPANMAAQLDRIMPVATSQVSAVSGASEVLLIPVSNARNSNWNPNANPVLSAKMTVLPNGNTMPVTMQNGTPTTNISKVITPTTGVIPRFQTSAAQGVRFHSPAQSQSIANLRPHQAISPGQIVLKSAEPGKAPIVLNAIQTVSSPAPSGFSPMQIIRPPIKLSANSSVASSVISQQVPQTTQMKQVVSGIPTKGFLSPAVATLGDRKPLTGIPANTTVPSVSPMCSVYPIRLAPPVATPVSGNERSGYHSVPGVSLIPQQVQQRMPVQQLLSMSNSYQTNQRPVSAKFLAIGDLQNSANVTILKPQQGKKYTNCPVTVIHPPASYKNAQNKTKEMTQSADQKKEVTDTVDESCSKLKVSGTEASEKDQIVAASDSVSKQATDAENSELKNVDETEKLVEEKDSTFERTTKPEVGEQFVIDSRLVTNEDQDLENSDFEKDSKLQAESEVKVSATVSDSRIDKNVENTDTTNEDQQDHSDILQVVNNAAIDIANTLHSIDDLDQTDKAVIQDAKKEMTTIEEVKKDAIQAEDLKDMIAIEDIKKDVTVIEDEDSDGCLIIDEAGAWAAKPANSMFNADELSEALEQREQLLEERKKRKLAVDVGATDGLEMGDQPAKKRCTPGPVTLMSNTEETDDIDVMSFDGDETDSLRGSSSGRRKSKQKMKWEPEDFTLQRVKAKMKSPASSVKPESPPDDELRLHGSKMKPMRERHRRLQLSRLFMTLGQTAFKYNPRVAQLVKQNIYIHNTGIPRIMILDEARNLIAAQKMRNNNLKALQAELRCQQQQLSVTLQQHVEQFLRSGVPETIIYNFLKSVSRAAFAIYPKSKTNSANNSTAEDDDSHLEYNRITIEDIQKSQSRLGNFKEKTEEFTNDTAQSSTNYDTPQNSANYDTAAQSSSIVLQADPSIVMHSQANVPGLYKQSLLNLQMLAQTSSKEKGMNSAQRPSISSSSGADSDVVLMDSKPDMEVDDMKSVGNDRLGNKNVDKLRSVVNNTAQLINIYVNTHDLDKSEMDAEVLRSVVSADIHDGEAAASDEDEIRSSTGYDSVLDEEMDYLEADITGDTVVQEESSKMSQDSAVLKMCDEYASTMSQDCASKTSEESALSKPKHCASKMCEEISNMFEESASKTSEVYASRVSMDSSSNTTVECALETSEVFTSKTSEDHTSKTSEEPTAKLSEVHAPQTSALATKISVDSATSLPVNPALTDSLFKSSDPVLRVSDFAPKIPECAVGELMDSDEGAAFSDSDIICVNADPHISDSDITSSPSKIP